MRHASRMRRGFTMIELVIVLIIFLMLGGVTVAVACRSRETANRVRCASNLKQIGLAIILYSNANRGAYPRTIHDPTTGVTTQYAGWQAASPFIPTGPSANDVTAGLFLLIRTQGLASQTFVCPSRHEDVRAWNFNGGAASSVSNFPHRGVLSYGYQNLYFLPQAERTMKYRSAVPIEFAVAADMSPGGAALPTLTPKASARQMKAGNSPNHDGDGQNVLFGDDHVEFLQNPFVGVNRDNIYTAAGGPVLPGQSFATSPIDGNDSVILPTALDGPVPPAPPWYTWWWVLVAAGAASILLMLAWLLRMTAGDSPALAGNKSASDLRSSWILSP